jgi:polyribonucleotide nucleotidyltransferase
MDKKIAEYTLKYGQSDLTIKINQMAQLADASVTVSWGETVVLATVVMADEPKEGVDYLPLLVDYEERLYASGKISGSRFVKREGRPSDQAVLAARAIDRPLRPLFPKNFRNDIQVVVTILSFDMEHDPAVISIIAASAALMFSRAPFSGPVGAVRIGQIDGQLKLNPTDSQLEKSDLELTLAGTKDKVMMLEAFGKEISEEVIKKAVRLAQKELQPIIELQEKLAKDVVSIEPEETDDKILDEINRYLGTELREALRLKQDEERRQKLASFRIKVLDNFEGNYKQIELQDALDRLIQKEVRQEILKNSRRPDGRKLDEIRPLDIKVGLLPRTHGSGLFSRGQTQSLTIVTLGPPGDEQFIDTMEEEGTKRYMHHYNFPPFCTGEVMSIRSASRREIGHGALAEKALLPVIPDRESFPYTIRLVSEILASNGSSSMAATCGSTLALMDAGVAIKAPVAGIAIGLITKDGFDDIPVQDIKPEDYKILTDIQGIEDFGGDMDFKVAGSSRGITAIQMDTKLHGITPEIIRQALKAAKVARLKILDEMAKVIPEPRKDISRYAPRIEKLMISPKRIGDVIGPGGKTIRKIIESCGGDQTISIDIEDSGLVLISSTNPEMGEKAKKIIEDLTYKVKLDEVFDGKVVEIVRNRTSGQEIGALVEIKPGKVGMVHISEISQNRIPDVSSVLKIGQSVKVKVIKIDEEQGRYSLSIKRLERGR